MSTILMCFFQTFFYFLMFFVDIPKQVVYHIRKGGVEMFGKRIENCGKRIEIALSIRNMKQCELCRLANVPKSSLSLYLSGAYEPKQDRIYSMARVLGVDEVWLMGYDVPMEKEKPNSPIVEQQVTKSEQLLLELFRKVPENKQEMVIQMIQVALNT